MMDAKVYDLLDEYAASFDEIKQVNVYSALRFIIIRNSLFSAIGILSRFK